MQNNNICLIFALQVWKTPLFYLLLQKKYYMARIMGIDYGKKRIGIAVTDPLQIAANALTTVSPNEIFPFLEKYLSENQVDCIVVGYARQMNGNDSESMKWTIPFVEKLKKTFSSMKIEFADERFTSKLAHQTMLSAGLKRKDRQNKELVDRISATIILQDYLENKRINIAPIF